MKNRDWDRENRHRSTEGKDLRAKSALIKTNRLMQKSRFFDVSVLGTRVFPLVWSICWLRVRQTRALVGVQF